MKIMVKTVRLGHQADHEKRDEKTNKIEPEEYQQILVCKRNKIQQLILRMNRQKGRRRIKVKDGSETKRHQIIQNYKSH